MLVHGLIDENVHFRHTVRLINRLVAAGKDYDLLIFPDERHSPRRLRDRIYMEQRISDYFLRHLGVGPAALPTNGGTMNGHGQVTVTGGTTASVSITRSNQGHGMRPLAGNL